MGIRYNHPWKLTASFPWKMNGWKTILSSWVTCQWLLLLNFGGIFFWASQKKPVTMVFQFEIRFIWYIYIYIWASFWYSKYIFLVWYTIILRFFVFEHVHPNKNPHHPKNGTTNRPNIHRPCRNLGRSGCQVEFAVPGGYFWFKRSTSVGTVREAKKEKIHGMVYYMGVSKN